MGKIVLKSALILVKIKGKEERISILDNEQFAQFNPDILGLGKITLPSKQVEAIVALFDLSGFTNFCKQVDPHLCVPEYMSQFLAWLFEEIKKEFVQKSYSEGKQLWAELPFLAKFMGDGVLFLWNSEGMSDNSLGNIVVSLLVVCEDYKSVFYPKIKKFVVDPPMGLRCGIARGKVFSVGDGNDYVGSCINIAARLQKLSLLTFCVSRRGFDFEKCMVPNAVKDYLLKAVSLRGIGANELVWVLRDEFNKLPDAEKGLFTNP